MQGHPLGGGGGGSGTTKMSPEELRRSRLAALERNQLPSSSGDSNLNSNVAPSTSTRTDPLFSNPPPLQTVSFLEHDDGDEDLQRALAMSLQADLDDHVPAFTTTSASATTATTTTSSSLLTSAFHPPMLGQGKYDELVVEDSKPAAAEGPLVVHAEGYYDIGPFHAIMWDSQTTTENDKMRWVGQGIHHHVMASATTLDHEEGRIPASAATSTERESSSSSPAAGYANHSNYNNNNNNNNNNVLDELAQSHTPWGLQQQHGGPCGVLAAVQAELLRILIWGRRRNWTDTDNDIIIHGHAPMTGTSTATNTTNTTLEYPTSSQHVQSCTEPIASLVRPALARALGMILARAALTPLTGDAVTTAVPRKPIVRIVLPKQGVALQWEDLEPWISSSSSTSAAAGTASSRLQVFTLQERDIAATAKRQKRQDQTTADLMNNVARQVSDFLLQPLPTTSTAAAAGTVSLDDDVHQNRIPLDSFAHPGGVLLLVMSVVASRGASVIQEEFDDPVGTKLTAQFGHCGQELMNLLLTGQAVSNVFDNTMNLGEAMVCRGITRRPVVGYLTQLEALRYCQVGGYYKSPHFPVWVVGSTSHFTVLFGDASALEETASDRLLEKCRRAFKDVEGADDNGFIPVDQLGRVLQSLEIDVGDNISALAAHLEVSGASIILWDDFWKTASRLLTGATLDSILGGTILSADDQPPPLIRAETPPPPPQSVSSVANETDEEMARRLAAEWEAEEAPLRGINFLGEAARAASPIPMDISQAAPAGPPQAAQQPPPGMTSDEMLAWKLQAEWDADYSVAGGSHQAVGGSPAPSDELMPLPGTPPRKSFAAESDDAKPPVDRTVRFTDEPPRLQFEQYGDSFTLYHYNGLRGGTLTRFRVTRLSPEEAVGASIALNRGNASDGSGDLEDVVRTKWPSCMVDWAGKRPPYID